MLRHPGAIQPSRLFLGAILTGCFLLLVSLAVSDAQVPSAITPDGMLDTVVTPDGRVFNITGGTRPDQGPNLFHSFGQFDVGTGDTAHFVGQPGIDNIISRVTGGSESLIDGRLQSDASLFLLNPSGLMFGPNATLDVNGSFHASTADVLRFVDGATFSAHLNEKSTLTVAVPSAFGFLGADPAGIVIEESTLQVPEGETLSIVGGDIEITGGPQGFLAAPAGQIHIVSVASPGEVVPEISAHGSSLNVESFEHLGNVTISDLVPNDTSGERGGIDTSGERGGTIAIRGGNLLIEDSFILADTLGDIDGASIGREQGGNVTVRATEMVSLDGSSIYTNTQGQGERAGDAGTVVVEAPRVTLTGGAQIQSVTFGSGQGGNVTVRATDTVGLEGSFIYVNAVGQGEGAGDAGTVVVEAPRVTLTGGAQIVSDTLGPGQGGNVTVRATETVSLEGSSIHTSDFWQGEAAGAAGTVVVEAPRVTLTGGAQIQSITFGSGQGGNVTVRATETVNLESSFIYVNAVGQGEAAGTAGTVVMEALRVTLTGGAQIQSATLGQGRGGDIALSAPHVQLTDRSSVSAESTGSGEAGNIHIAAQEVALRGGSAVTTTAGQGEASGGNILIGGTITDDGVIIEGVEALTLDGSQMTANTDTGSGANINVGVQRLVLDGASALTANTGAGTGGNLRVAGAVSADGTITARAETVVLRGSRLTANAETGTGGRIDVVTEAFLADPASIINASSQAGGIDGVVNVEAVVSNLSEIVTPLPPDFASAASLLRDQCAARLREGQLSSLVVSGRTGMPARPGGILPSPVFRAERGPMVTSKQAEPLAGAVAFHPKGDGAPAHDMRQGWMSFQHGDFEQAVLHWQQAMRALEREGEADQQSVVLAYLAQVYQKLGHYQQALQSLQAAQTLAARSGDQVLEALILGELGNVHLPLGRLDQASRYLHDGLRLARAMKADDLVATVLNNRGNLSASQAAFDEALRDYRESARLAQLMGNHALTARALTNAALITLRRGEPKEAQALVEQALPVLQALSPSHEKAYGLISIGLIYANLRSHLPTMDASLLPLARRSFNDAIAVARASSDDRAASYAWGYLGHLYEGEGRYQEALDLTRRAVFAAQHVQAPEASYQWQWQSGRVLQALGQRKVAMAAYRQAVQTLQAMRDEMLVAYSEPLHIRETVAPVYAEFLDLLLQPGAAEEALEEARQLLESMKVAELQNHFKDECVAALRLRETSLDEVSQTAVVVYPILLPDRTELLVSLPTRAGDSKLQRFAVAIGADRITEEVRAFRQKLEKRTTRQYLRHAQRLYDWLVRPFEPALASLAVTTLVFVPDGPLRTIPMAALHDGEQFLIQKYALAITPGLNLTDPRPLPQPARVLAAGFSQPGQGLSSLPYVETELQAIANLYQSDFLLNQDFQISRLEKTLEKGLFPIVHIASHGRFSSDLDDTFILAFNDKLTLERLDQLLGPLRFRDEPIELLTLSACQTAAGDDQAALGLAGVAVKAGARSALATLWYINDQASSELVAEFYRQLRVPSVSRATALQRAQIYLLDNPDYQHPSYWAPFLLINNWL